MRLTRKLIVFFALLLCTVGLASADPFLDPALVGYWNFDEGSGAVAGDSSSFGNDATITGGAAWVTGKRGQGLSLDGVDDTVRMPDTPELRPDSEVTVSIWVKDPIGYLAGFAHWDGGSWNPYGMRYSHGSSHKIFTEVVTENGHPVKKVILGVPTDWNHYVMTYDNDELRLYQNGVLIDNTPFAGSQIVYNAFGLQQFVVGVDKGNRHLQAEVDEVAVWDRALTASEVDEVFDAGSAPTDTTPPSTPTNLVGVVDTTTIDVTWDPAIDPESGISQYKVTAKWGSFGFDQQFTPNTFATVSNLPPDTVVLVNVSAFNGAGIEGHSVSDFFQTLPDTSAPEILFAEVLADRTRVNLTLSEEVDQATAENPANYVISGGVSVISAMQTAPNIVVLTTTAHGDYTVTMDNVEDLAGNAAVNEQEDYSMLGCFS